MIIYLEGPDGSGKTTLVQHIWDRLVKKYYLTIGAEDDIPTNPKYAGTRVDEKTLFKKLKQMAKSNVIYVIDRGPLSDIIYRTFDSYEPVTSLARIRDFLRNYNSKILFIYCNTENAEEKMLERGDTNPIAIARHKEITRLYNIIVPLLENDCRYNCIRYDFNKPSNVKATMNSIEYFCYMSNSKQTGGPNGR